MTATVRLGKISDSYQRYIGSLGVELKAGHGMNASTHVASVRMNPEAPTHHERAVVKLFHLSDKGWFNEYAAWTLAQRLGVKTSPRASIMVGTRGDITPEHGKELNEAVRYVTTPIVLWCTSAVEPSKNIQAQLGRFWEKAVLHTEAGQRMGAMDGWLGNCDRIETNALWWAVEGGGLVAIDHEKAAFNQDWTVRQPEHHDEPDAASTKPVLETTLLKSIHAAMASRDKATRKAAKGLANAMYYISEQQHAPAWAELAHQLQQQAETNFGTQAAARLLSFLTYRVTEDCIRRRFGLAT